MTTLEKSELACKLLDRAIAMYFADEDPLFVMSLAHPAHLILQNLAERRFPGDNMSQQVWRELDAKGIKELEDGSVVEDYRSYLKYLHRVPNSAKHANDPAETHVDYDESHAIAIMSNAIAHAQQLDCGSQLGVLFVVWLSALNENVGNWVIRESADRKFPGLAAMPRDERRLAGRRAVEQIYRFESNYVT